MKLIRISIALLLASTAVAFAGSAKHDCDLSVDFATYKTFQWVEANQAGDGSTTNHADSPMVRNRIQSALERELMADGLTASNGETPDIYIAYYATIKGQSPIGYDLPRLPRIPPFSPVLGLVRQCDGQDL